MDSIASLARNHDPRTDSSFVDFYADNYKERMQKAFMEDAGRYRERDKRKLH